MAYIAHAAARLFAEAGVAPGFIIPTGNLGHGFAAVYARAMVAPIGPIVLATNANRHPSRWRAEGAYQPGTSVAIPAHAMTVGAPRHSERPAHLRNQLRAVSGVHVDGRVSSATVIT